MAELKNIGNGIGMIDLAPYTTQVLQLRQLMAGEKNKELSAIKDALEIQKLKGEIDTQPAKTAVDQQKGLDAAFSAYVGGDYTRATQLSQAITGKKEEVRPHPVKAKRDAGVAMIFDPDTGTEREYDHFAATRLNEKIKVEADLLKKAGEVKIVGPKEIATFAQGLLKDKIATTGAEALQIAQTLFAAANKKTAAGVRYSDLPADVIAEHRKSGMIVDAAMRHTDAAKGQPDPLGRRMVPRKDVPDKDRGEFVGIVNMNRFLQRDALPFFVEVAKDATLGTNIASAKIQDVLSKIGQNDPRYQALNNLTGTAFFDRLKELSGTATPEPELKRREKFFIQGSDTVTQAMAKVAGLVAYNATAANTKLQGLEATDHDTGGLRNLFAGVDVPELPAAEAQSILNNIPAEQRKDSAFMDNFVEMLPPGMRAAIDQVLSKAGTPRKSGVARDVKKALGIGQ